MIQGIILNHNHLIEIYIVETYFRAEVNNESARYYRTIQEKSGWFSNDEDLSKQFSFYSEPEPEQELDFS
jgi:hypothetical protein